jgi:hypothetical protein
MFSAAVGHSEDTDATAVANELVDRCTKQLGDAPAKAGLLFAAIDFDHQELLDQIDRRVPGLELIGCTTDGELSSEIGFREDSATLILFASDTVDLTTGVGRAMSRDLAGACRSAAEQAQAKTVKRPRLYVTAPEGLTSEGYILTKTLQETVGLDIPIFGALAGDQWRLKNTKQFYGTTVLSDSVPVMLFSGEFTFSYGVAGGWRQVGEVGRVTRATGAVVHEIDDAPAVDFYRRYLGSGVNPTVEMPLAILDASDRIEYLRGSWGVVDDATGAVTFLAAIPEGARVQVTVTDRDSILKGCLESLSIATSNLPDGVKADIGLFFSCCARKLMLGTRTEEELKLVRGVLGDQVPVCGFYGYGELSPQQGDPTGTKYHNESFVSLLIVA